MAGSSAPPQHDSSHRYPQSPSYPSNHVITTNPPQYPSGPCNFRDLSGGSSGANCGCRHFWLNDVSQILFGHSSQGSRDNYSKAECFCGHHACFHELEPTALSQISAGAEIGGAIQIHGSAVFNPQPNNPCQPANRAEHLGSDIGSRCVSSPRSAQGNLKPLFRQPYKQDQSSGLIAQELRGSTASRNASQHNAEQTGLGLYWGSSAHGDASRTSSRRATSMKSPPARNGPTSQVGLGFQPSPRHFHYNLVPQLQENACNLDVAMLPANNNADEFAQSVTEVATPSNAGTPALRGAEDGFHPANHHVGDAITGASANSVRGVLPPWDRQNGNTNHWPNMEAETTGLPGAKDYQASSPEASLTHVEISILKHLLGSTPNLGTSLRNLSKRLEALETTSFSHVSEQAVQDVLEHFEVRLIELTTRLDDLESTKASFSQDGRILKPHITTTQPLQREIAAATLERLAERLDFLESVAPPTFSQPWQVEVILLPWGRQLKGIWFNREEASQASGLTTRESGAHSMKRALSRSYGPHSIRQSQAVQDWELCSDDWLSPKACSSTQGLGGKVYERLSSRGLVRQVKISGRDASSVHSAILSSFEDLFEELAGQTPGEALDSSSHSQTLPLGLRSEFVPLRKVHKTSMLRFLSSAELATPSLWNADFLDASVFMKAASGRKKLFITQPAAYIQSKETRKTSWNWQKLRELPRFVPDEVDEKGSNPSFVGEADAREPCWMFDARLDENSSLQSSFTSSHKDSLQKGSFVSSHPPSPEQTLHDTLLSDSEEDSDAEELSASQQSIDPLHISISPPHRHTPITPVSEAISAAALDRAEYRRTVSLPLAEPDTTMTPKRQAASFEQTSPVRLDKQQQLKRRRLSRDAEDIIGRGVRGPGDNMTPRRSREPPSPHQSENTMEIRANWFDRRATTPSAYATPFSNNAIVGWMEGDESMDEDEDGDEQDDDDDDDEGDESASSQGSNKDMHANDEDAWAGLDEDSNEDEAEAEHSEDEAHIEAIGDDYYDDANDHHAGVI